MKRGSRTNKLKEVGVWYEATTNWATLVGRAMGMLAVFVMTIIVTGDVILRYVFNAPSMWVSEISSYLLIVVVILGLAYTQKERGHIRVDIVLSRLSNAVRCRVELVLLVMGLFLTVILTYITGGDFIQTVEFGTTSDSVMAFPLAPWRACIVIGFVVLALVFIQQIYTQVMKIK